MYLTVGDINKGWLFRHGPLAGADGPKNVGERLTAINELNALGWCKKPAQDTLRMFDQNPNTDPKITPYYKTSVWMVSRGKWWHGAKTATDCVKRTLHFAKTLRSSVAREGIKSPITIIIKGNGKIFLQDGYHRLFITDYIDYKKAIPVVVKAVGPNFKAIEKLMLKLGAGKKFTYHPVNDASSALYHPYFRGWGSWRADTPTRYRAILAKLGGVKSVLDIGAAEGYFSINLAAKGYDVTAIELNANRAKVLKFFSNLREVSFPVAVEDWQSYCARTDKEFDAAIFLSTFHHQVIHHGLEAFKKLGLIKTKKLFFEMACNKEPKMAKFPTLSNNEIIRRMLENTKFTHWTKIYTGQRAFAMRDIFMFV